MAYGKNLIIDAHSHIQFLIYDGDREQVIERARNNGVKMLAVGTQAATSEAAIKLAHQYPEEIWATVGFHPSHLSDKWFHDKNEQKEAISEKFDIKKMRELAKDLRVVAIGECGLDYYRLAEGEKPEVKNLQREVFLEQAKLAQELQKPLMIHCRPSKGTDDAYEDLLNLSQKSYIKSQMSIIHFYVGSLAMAKKLVNAGFYFTFGGVITFARDYDNSIKYIPLDKILLETDCPYASPQSWRGKKNEPAYISETAVALARIKNVGLDEALKQIYKNSVKLFQIKDSVRSLEKDFFD